MRVFISHSKHDVEIAKFVIAVLRNALNLESMDIRCRGVDGYRLSAGAPTDEILRREVDDFVSVTTFTQTCTHHRSTSEATQHFAVDARIATLVRFDDVGRRRLAQIGIMLSVLAHCPERVACVGAYGRRMAKGRMGA